MRNIEKYEKEILKIAKNTGQSIAIHKKTKEMQPCGDTVCSNCVFSNSPEGYCNYLRYSWLLDEYKEPPILDDEEKRYLENLLKPFKDSVTWIQKNCFYGYPNEEFIRITYINRLRNDDEDCIFLPSFVVNTMYKGMERNKSYTLEELGLFKEGK